MANGRRTPLSGIERPKRAELVKAFPPPVGIQCQPVYAEADVRGRRTTEAPTDVSRGKESNQRADEDVLGDVWPAGDSTGDCVRVSAGNYVSPGAGLIGRVNRD